MRNLKFFLLVLSCCIAAMSDRASAATYYVSPSGDDSNPGNDYPGNLLLTAEDAGTRTQPIVIGSYGSGRAKIKAGNGSGVTKRNAGGVEVKDLVVTGDDYKTNVGSGIKIVNELPNNQKLVEGNPD